MVMESHESYNYPQSQDKGSSNSFINQTVIVNNGFKTQKAATPRHHDQLPAHERLYLQHMDNQKRKRELVQLSKLLEDEES